MKSGLIVAGCALALGGCATVVNGPNVDYTMNTDPEGATIALSNGMSCESPCTLSLPRKNDLRADITREGYEPTSVYIQSKAGGATVGNILAGGVIGAVVDSGNGANRFLSPRPLNVKLAAAGSETAAELLDDDGKSISSVAIHNAEVAEKIDFAILTEEDKAASKAAEEGTAEAETNDGE